MINCFEYGISDDDDEDDDDSKLIFEISLNTLQPLLFNVHITSDLPIHPMSLK